MKSINPFLNEDQVETLKRRLLLEKQKLTIKWSNLKDFCLDKNELSDPLDEANINVQTSQELRFRNREIFYLKKIEKGLSRIEEKTYGLCKECSNEIGYERLLARPTAELCIFCKEQMETSEHSNFFHRQSQSQGRGLNEVVFH